MTAPRRRILNVPDDVRKGLLRLQRVLELPQAFPDDVVDQACALLAAPPDFDSHEDLTDVPFITIDPAGAMDLDQAMHITGDGGGYLVRYAIADVASWVEPGSPIDLEARRRGQTMYAPHANVPLHPRELSEQAASLLADGRARPAMVWTHELDAAGDVTATSLVRAMVQNTARLSYDEVQAHVEDGSACETEALLSRVGPLRQALEVERGGISLNLPDQEIVAGDGTWLPVFRRLLPSEDWNARISLLTGMAAADLMVAGRVGVLRTLPPAEDFAVARLRHAARTLGVEWPRGLGYPDFVRSLDPNDPRELAVLEKCTALFRGAGYVAFDGALPNGNLLHAALATHYAHTTAPLRRLVDRFVLEVCHSLANGIHVPDWAAGALGDLPAAMAASGRKARAYERGAIDLAEALTLEHRVGEIFDAVLVDVHPRTGVGTFQIADPAIEAHLEARSTQVGEHIRARLDRVDTLKGELVFSQPN